ncbi:polynucleotide adenylyltransferase PcnB [Thiohalomonas denitrificans]|uniref:Poly(A) polymerase I n=1 Tax=Thiohalomonas denitrificans TaxID=415747 RepID=A0A1G5Q0F9_9GAMM|nr:polynucleotide adenylyltransferase PcnB [Thiohalomonas denitrificans]SCZ55108.1 poly(A) polymerase [Thiohalomonas denitrificans]
MFSWLKRSIQKLTVPYVTATEDPQPVVIPRSGHIISRSNISENALKVLYRLRKAGYQSFLVGGGVRDLLLGREPKDFDIATDAHPEEVKDLFRNCRLIGRRFRLAHVHFGREIIEVATFRTSHDGSAKEGRTEGGMIVRDNVYGSVEDDAWRRDFTINALYYDIADFSVVDYTGGMADLRAGRLRIIGDPMERYREDPVRMLRAVRFAAKLGFRIDEASEAAIIELGAALRDVPPARLFDEVLKLFMSGYGVETYELMRHYRLFGELFPDTEGALAHEQEHFPHTLIARALTNTDERIAAGRPVTPAFLFAALLWDTASERAARLREEGRSPIEAIQMAGDAAVAHQVERVAFPKRFSLQSREIWAMQERLTKRGGGAPFRLLGHPRFRAAYDFLLLRAESGEDVEELADWWTRFQEADEEERGAMTRAFRTKGKRRRRRRGKPKQTQQQQS